MAGGMVEVAQSVAFLDYFSDLADPRQAGKALYPLDEIMFMLLCGNLHLGFCAASDLSSVAFQVMTPSATALWLGLKVYAPSHQTQPAPRSLLSMARPPDAAATGPRGDQCKGEQDCCHSPIAGNARAQGGLGDH
jgi:hypothetical protein